MPLINIEPKLDDKGCPTCQGCPFYVVFNHSSDYADYHGTCGYLRIVTDTLPPATCPVHPATNSALLTRLGVRPATKAALQPITTIPHKYPDWIDRTYSRRDLHAQHDEWDDSCGGTGDVSPYDGYSIDIGSRE